MTYEEEVQNKREIRDQIKAEIDALVLEEVSLKKSFVPIKNELWDLRKSKDAENVPNNTFLDRILKKLGLKKLSTYEKIKKLEPLEMEIEEQLGFLDMEINDLQNELMDLYTPEKEDDETSA